MTVKVFIPHRFPSLNDYIDEERKHRYAAAKMKKEWTDLSATYFKHLPKIDEPVYLQFVWHELNTRRDPDNIIFAKKFVLDGLVASGALEDDNQKWVAGIEETWDVNKERVGVEVILSW